MERRRNETVELVPTVRRGEALGGVMYESANLGALRLLIEFAIGAMQRLLIDRGTWRYFGIAGRLASPLLAFPVALHSQCDAGQARVSLRHELLPLFVEIEVATDGDIARSPWSATCPTEVCDRSLWN